MKYLFVLAALTVVSANLALVRGTTPIPLTDDQLTDNGYSYGDLGKLFK